MVIKKGLSGLGDALKLHLDAFARLSPDERALLERVAGRHVREAGARRDMVREGDKPRAVTIMLDGWACRYKQLPDGRRQVIAFLLPGDLGDANNFILKEMDHSIGAITKVRYAELPPQEFEALTAQSPRISRALWWHALVTIAVQREWTANVGQRSAYERIAHLLCELFLRLRRIGLTQGASCDFPLTQTDLADAAGLTSVHVNRTVQEMRRSGLIELTGKKLTIPDLAQLMNAAMFNPNYLHLDDEGQDLAAND